MADTCTKCHLPLILDVTDRDEEDEDVEMGESSAAGSAAKTQTVPDSVKLMSCFCHFHWDCLIDAYSDGGGCPNCSQNISSENSGVRQVLCDLNNEGGLQENLDILPLLTEENYLKANPGHRKCRAFLEFCREGNVEAIIGLLQDEDPDDGDVPDVDVLRYQDPLGDMQSGLHAAVMAGSREVAWLLLLLASELNLLEFPPEVFQEAEALGVMREDQTGKVDIRSLRDAQGKSAEELAAEVRGVWIGWPGSGRLSL
ncbi:hypothetical protein K402DRAFT_413253 [Aulographum hederae CBS 113979]|uniref:Uncharacterized protein n=1 Tax=Aulographum hederae CBS 113979 TaxID=1176131 RepID=A0A6G1GX42_9PEZI|nr:hypothetical protein K402DRAFT_413253 [Aulographum hederae CBS 113979]